MIHEGTRDLIGRCKAILGAIKFSRFDRACRFNLHGEEFF